MIPEQKSATAGEAAYPVAGGMVLPTAGPGGPAVQQVLLPNGQVVTGYALAQPVPVAQQPARVVERRGGIDPTAQKLFGAGVLALGVGAGGSMLLSAVAAATTGLGVLAACLVLVSVLRGSGGGAGGGVRVNVRVDPTITASSWTEER